MSEPEKPTQNSGVTAANKNLRPFAPGQSGNPGGRPKKQPITDYLREQLEADVPSALLERLKPADRVVAMEVLGSSPTFGQFVAFRTIQQAIHGDMFALRELLDRVEGKVTQKIAGGNGGAIELKVTRILVPSHTQTEISKPPAKPDWE